MERRRLKRRAGGVQASSERMDLGRPNGGWGVSSVKEPALEARSEPVPSNMTLDWRRLVRMRSAVVRGSICRVKSSLISSRACEKRRRSLLLAGRSMMDGSRCSSPYMCNGVESGESCLVGVE